MRNMQKSVQIKSSARKFLTSLTLCRKRQVLRIRQLTESSFPDLHRKFM